MLEHTKLESNPEHDVVISSVLAGYFGPNGELWRYRSGSNFERLFTHVKNTNISSEKLENFWQEKSPGFKLKEFLNKYLNGFPPCKILVRGLRDEDSRNEWDTNIIGVDISLTEKLPKSKEAMYISRAGIDLERNEFTSEDLIIKVPSDKKWGGFAKKWQINTFEIAGKMNMEKIPMLGSKAVGGYV